MGKKKSGKNKKKGSGPKPTRPSDEAWRKERRRKKVERREARSEKKVVQNRCSKCKRPTAKLTAMLCRRCFRRWDGE